MKQDRRVTKTKKSIKDAFTSLMLETHSLQSISVTKLVEKADIGRGTFYLHYSDLDALQDEIEDDILMEFEESIKTDNLSSEYSFEIFIRDIISFVQSNREILKILIIQNKDNTFTFKLKNTAKRIIFSSSPKAQNRKSTNYTEYYYSFIFAGTVDLIIEWLQGMIDESAESLATIIERIIFEGFKMLEE